MNLVEGPGYLRNQSFICSSCVIITLCLTSYSNVRYKSESLCAVPSKQTIRMDHFQMIGIVVKSHKESWDILLYTLINFTSIKNLYI